MDLENKKILIVDDDPINNALICDFVSEFKFIPLSALDGDSGLAILNENQDISAVLLDWIMPGMSGVEMLKKIKQKENISKIPIIMQTGKRDQESIAEGIEAGAYYYLTKPYDLNVLSTILKKAIQEYENHLAIIKQINEKDNKIFNFLKSGEIHFKTPQEALTISSLFSAFTQNEETSIGLSELLVNAVEHGNLDIGFKKKEEYLMNDTLDSEIKKRLSEKENIEKYVSLSFEKSEDHLKMIIEDMGKGFDVKKYLKIDPARVFDLHGRGVAMANMIFKNGLIFNEKGNKVEINLDLS